METQTGKTTAHQSFRVDVQLHDLLVNKSGRGPQNLLPAPAEPQTLSLIHISAWIIFRPSSTYTQAGFSTHTSLPALQASTAM